MDFISLLNNNNNMEIRTEQRGELPAQVEEIGLGKWHLRWNIINKTDKETNISYFEYNEVALGHKPTLSEIKSMTSK